MKLKNKLKINMDFSKELCEVLNKEIKNKEVVYLPFASNEDIGIKQVLDKRGLQYNEMCFKDTIIEAGTLEEIKHVIYCNLGRGLFLQYIQLQKT
jgi:hypothetical protein